MLFPDHSAPETAGESSPVPGSTHSHCPAVAGQSMVPRYNIHPRRASSFSECGEGKEQFALPSAGIRCLCPQSCPVA